MEQKTALVTGANSGIGKATVIALAKQGIHVVMLCRDRARGEAAQTEVAKATGYEPDLMLCDLGNMREIRGFCEAFKKRFSRLDILINNAGVLSIRRQMTKDGLEIAFGVNYIGHFLLTNSLLDLMISTENARIVILGSVAYKLGKIDFNDLGMKKGYTLMAAYSRAKLCELLYTRELAKRLDGTGTTVNCVHPGVVATNIFIKTDAGIGRALMRLFRPVIKSPEEGAKGIVYVATSSECEGISGAYFSGAEAQDVVGRARDDALAKRLWEVSEQIVGDYL
ncbi:MAG: SDR family oxidoreductase [Eubacteriales bacterium]